MGTRFEFTPLALSLALAAVMLLTGCASRHDKHRSGNAPDPVVYDTTEKIQAMPSCKGVVVEKGPCYALLRTAEGEGFLIGSPASGIDVVQFVEALESGRSYKFPESFRKYQAGKSPRVDQASEYKSD